MNVAVETTGDSAVPVRRARRRWDPLTRNGYLLIASSFVTSALGVAFWTLAAHRFNADAVGRSAAAIGLLTVLGNISQLNLVNALNRFVPVAGQQSRRLIVGAYGTIAVAGFVVAAIFLVGQPWWAPDLGALRDAPAAFVVFPLVVVAWTLFIVEDGALAGLRASEYVLGSNACYAVTKIGVLLVLPASASELGIFWAWSLTVIPVVMGVTWILWRRLRPIALSGEAGEVPAILEPVSLRPVARFAAADYTATMVFTATQGLLPVLLLALVGPSATAHFSLAWIVAYVPYLAGRAMAMSLLTEAARAPRELGALSWRTLHRAAAVVVPMVVVLFVGAPSVLRIFGAEYAEHGPTLLRLLALAALPGLVAGTYIAILRVRNRYRAQITLAVAMSAAVLGSVVPATSRFGVEAVGWIWLITHVAAALLLGLTELRRLCGPAVERSAQRLVGFGRRLLPGVKRRRRALARFVLDQSGRRPATPRWQRTSGAPRPDGMKKSVTSATTAICGPAARWIVIACVVGAVGLWLSGVASGIEWRDMTDVGLISVLPIVYFVALGLLTIGFVIAVFTPHLTDWWWRGCAALLVLALHATPTLVYGTLRYPWAWKHLGVVEFISRNGQVDTDVSDLSVYHGWPGFFSFNAMLVEAVGDLDLSAVAAWWPPMVNLTILAALQVVAGAFTSDRRVVAVTCWIFVLVSWAGQDYFSPQAMTYVLYLVLIGVVVRTLRVRPLTEECNLSRVSPRGQGALRMASTDQPSWMPIGLDDTRRGMRPRLGTRPATPVVVWLLAAAIVSSHQLTPVMLVLTCTAFVALRYAGGVWLPVALAALTAGWILVFAWPLVVESSDDITFGAVITNVRGTVSDLGVVSPGHAFVSLVARVLTGVVAAAGIAGWLHSARHHRANPGALVLMAAPLLLVALTAYGGEILFRVYTFALPGAAFFIASLMVLRRSARRAAATVLAVSTMLVPAFLVSHLGNERMYSFTTEEVELVTALYETAPAGSLIVEGSRNYPAQSRRYESFRYVPLDREPPPTRERIVAEPDLELERWLDDPEYTATYILLTRSMRIQTETLGTMPEDGLQHIETSLRASPRFTILASNADGVVFTLAARQGDGPPIPLDAEEGR